METKLAALSGIAVAVACVTTISASYLNGSDQDRQVRGEVPEEFLDVAHFLRRQGMANPNQGTYREAVVAYPNIYAGSMVEETVRGWVGEPDEDGARELLAWNGLTYDVVEVGALADLREDAKKGRLTAPLRIPSFNSAEIGGLYQISGPVPAAILALLGEGELAVEVSKRFLRSPMRNRGFVLNAIQHYDTILQDATTNRIVIAHDFEALIYARRLSRFRRTKNAYPPMAGRQSLQEVNTELWYADKWIENLHWRLDPGRSAPLTWEEIGRLPVAEQLPILVGLLDEERMPYGIRSLDEMPVSASTMLRDLGDDAIEYLLGSLQDTRMSRVMPMFGSIGTPRFTTVGEMCGGLVIYRLGLSGFAKKGVLYDREQLETVWMESRGMTNPERWLYALESDGLPEAVHKSASTALGRRETVLMRGARAQTSDHSLPIGPVVQWTELYDSDKERVVAALERRAEEKLAEMRKQPDGSEVPNYAGALPYAMTAAVWDILATKPLLLRIHAEYLADFDRKVASSYSFRGFAKLSSALIYSGEEVWDDFENALGRVDVTGTSVNLTELLTPIWQHPTHPRSKQIAERLFLTENSWHAKYTLERDFRQPSILFYLPAFEESVRQALNDKSVATQVVRTEPTRIEYVIRGQKHIRITRPGEFGIKEGEPLALRRCDTVMEPLARVFGLRDYGLFLSHEEKDKFIAQVLEKLEGGVDWASMEENRRPRIMNNEQLYCTAPIWPDYSKKN